MTLRVRSLLVTIFFSIFISFSVLNIGEKRKYVIFLSFKKSDIPGAIQTHWITGCFDNFCEIYWQISLSSTQNMKKKDSSVGEKRNNFRVITFILQRQLGTSTSPTLLSYFLACLTATSKNRSASNHYYGTGMQSMILYFVIVVMLRRNQREKMH